MDAHRGPAGPARSDHRAIPGHRLRTGSGESVAATKARRICRLPGQHGDRGAARDAPVRSVRRARGERTVRRLPGRRARVARPLRRDRGRAPRRHGRGGSRALRADREEARRAHRAVAVAPRGRLVAQGRALLHHAGGRGGAIPVPGRRRPRARQLGAAVRDSRGVAAGQVLIGPEATKVLVADLRHGLQSIYLATAAEAAQLLAALPGAERETTVVNDGVFVAGFGALAAVDSALRRAPAVTQWVSARRDVWWRQKAALNLALAQARAIAPLDSAYNAQLHVEGAVSGGGDGRPAALWRGRPAKVLHFNGAGRSAYGAWRRSVLGEPR